MTFLKRTFTSLVRALAVKKSNENDLQLLIAALNERGYMFDNCSIPSVSELSFFPLLMTVAIAICSASVSYSNVKKTRSLNKAKRSQIKSRKSYYAKIYGEVTSENSLISPLSGLPCVYYSFTVAIQKGPKGDQYYKKVESGTSDNSFSISDSTDKYLVYPSNADINIQATTWNGYSPRPEKIASDPYGLSKIAANHHATYKNRYEYNEILITKGTKLFIVSNIRNSKSTNGERIIGKSRQLNTPYIISDETHESVHNSHKLLALSWGGLLALTLYFGIYPLMC